MLTRSELGKIARGRLRDAEVLLAAGRYDGAIYLGGYVVEIALKNRICKTLSWAGFPQKPNEFEGLQSFKVHKLSTLLRLSGVETKIKTRHMAEWSFVDSSWNPESRYNPIGSASKPDAELLVEAA